MPGIPSSLARSTPDNWSASTCGRAALDCQVWEGIEGSDARGLPFPIESIADCARGLTAVDPRFEGMMELGRRVALDVVSELTDFRCGPRCRGSASGCSMW